jgi:hypothetical protein
MMDILEIARCLSANLSGSKVIDEVDSLVQKNTNLVLTCVRVCVCVCMCVCVSVIY